MNNVPELTTNYNRLLMAILAQAANDARHGDLQAALWLVTDGAEYLDILKMDPDLPRRHVADWYGCSLAALQPLVA